MSGPTRSGSGGAALAPCGNSDGIAASDAPRKKSRRPKCFLRNSYIFPCPFRLTAQVDNCVGFQQRQRDLGGAAGGDKIYKTGAGVIVSPYLMFLELPVNAHADPPNRPGRGSVVKEMDTRL